MNTDNLVSMSSFVKFRFRVLWCFWLATAVLFFGLAPEIYSQSKSATTNGTISLTAVDLDGNPLSSFIAGQFIRLQAVANLGNLPEKASVKIGLSAAFTTKIYGKTVGYAVKLPLSGEAGSRIDPSIGLPTSGAPLGADLRNTSYHEVIDFQIPPEMPNGVLTISVTVAATSAKTLLKSFSFKIVRN